jgi:hypothetical protein
MKTFSISLFLFGVFFAQAQTSEYQYFYADNYFGEYEQLYDTSFFNRLKRNKVAEIHSKYNSGKYNSSHQVTFDSLARPNTNTYTSGKYFYSKQYFFDEQHPNKFSKIFEYDKHQKELKVKLFKYDEKGRDIYYESFRKGKLANKVLTSYNDNGKVAERTIYHKSASVPAVKYEYDFYEDNNPKETRYYKKGKLKYTWHYDCEPKGTLEKAQKDTTTVCIKQEIDSLGRKINYRQETDPKNRVITTRSVFRDTDEINPEEVLKTYLNGDTLMYWFRNEHEFIYKQYYKGKISWTQHTKYNGTKLATLTMSENYKKGKLKSNHTNNYYYNDKGLIEKRQYINQRKKELKTTEEIFEYKFY